MEYIKTFENYHQDDDKRAYKINSQEHKSKFLIDFDYTLAWAIEKNPHMEIAYQSIHDDISDNDSYWLDTFKGRIQELMQLYNSSKAKGSVAVTRQINVNDVEDINWNKIGVYWSFIPMEAMFFRDTNIKYCVTLHGTVSFDRIHWESSMDNYAYYGSEENEVQIINNSQIHCHKMEVTGSTDWNTEEKKWNTREIEIDIIAKA
jgi:hypothetical protein